MSETMIVAVLSLIGTGAGSLCGLLINNRLIAYKIDQLSKRVDKHNNFAERVPVIEEQIKVINHIINSDR